MRCPFCRHPDSRVVDSREADDGAAIRRRRSCPECGRRFTTMEEASLSVVKRNGTKEPFSRSNVVSGVRRACKGRPVDDDQLAALAQQVEETIRAAGASEVPSGDIGLAILQPLRELDEVAYLRFASVYRGFSSLADFEREVAGMRALGSRGTASSPAYASSPAVETSPAYASGAEHRHDSEHRHDPEQPHDPEPTAVQTDASVVRLRGADAR